MIIKRYNFMGNIKTSKLNQIHLKQQATNLNINNHYDIQGTEKHMVDTYARFTEAWNDIITGTKNWKFWTSMGVTEIKRRYNRTLLGPLWTTLNLALNIFSMSIVFSCLWKINIRNFLPYFASGYICWSFFATSITEGCAMFITAGELFKQIPLAYSNFAWLLVCRNIFIVVHHLILYALIMIVVGIPVSLNSFLFIPGVLILSLAVFSASFIVGLMCARYRDLLQVVGAILQVLMYITPILWIPSQVSGIRSTIFVKLNPLYHYINVIRAPMLGYAPELVNWVASGTITLILAVVAFWFFAIYKRKIIFWL